MKKILSVDDAPEIRNLMRATFDGEEYIVLEAEDGKSAIDLAAREMPEVIIMDVEMPGKINGVEATRAIKSNPETKACKVIVVSGSKLEKVSERCLAAGADAFLAKPYSPLELMETIERVIR